MKEKQPHGRPTTYMKVFDNMARRLCLAGWTDEELAVHFEINVDTLNLWKQYYKSFSEAILRGRYEQQFDVVESAYASCHDRTVIEEKAIKLRDVDADGTVTERTEIVQETRVIAGDPRAQQFMLRNRMPHKFSEKANSPDVVIENRPVVVMPDGQGGEISMPL